MPWTLLPFGRRRVFEEVVSLTSVFSLLVMWLCNSFESKGARTRQGLILLWPHLRNRVAAGLVSLEERLLALACDLWCLMDEPAASDDNLRAAIFRLQPSLILVGGECNLEHNGVQLPDGDYRGDAFSLESAEL